MTSKCTICIAVRMLLRCSSVWLQTSIMLARPELLSTARSRWCCAQGELNPWVCAHLRACRGAGFLCMCRALLNNPMKEGQDGIVTIQDVREPVFRALLYFVYADALPEVRSEPGDQGQGIKVFCRAYQYFVLHALLLL